MVLFCIILTSFKKLIKYIYSIIIFSDILIFIIIFQQEALTDTLLQFTFPTIFLLKTFEFSK